MTKEAKNILKELAAAWKEHQQFQKDIPRCKTPEQAKILRKQASETWGNITKLLDENAKE